MADNVVLHLESTIATINTGDGTTKPALERQKGTAGSAHVNVQDIVLISGEDQTNNVIRIEGQFEYETVAASQTAQVLGASGAVGDLLHSIIITASTGTITVLDNATTVAVIPAAALGVWLFDLVSVSGAWKITTAASTSCTATGRFS